MSVHILIPLCFKYCSFVTCFEIWKSQLSISFFFLRLFWDIQGSFNSIWIWMLTYTPHSGLLRASTTKGSPPHFQVDQILQFPICVFKNLISSSNASTHIDQRHRHDKDLLLGLWTLRQPAKRMTSSLRDVPGARAPPCSQTCSGNFQLLARLGAFIHIVWGLSKSTE